MYIIYLLLSLLGIQSPYTANEHKHGDVHYIHATQIASDILRTTHSASEAICLGVSDANNTLVGNQNCLKGVVKQDSQQSIINKYGSGVVSLSDGVTYVLTFMPQSNDYRFNMTQIGGDVYDNLNKKLGTGVNSGYYDEKRDMIMLRNTHLVALPDDMRAYLLYDHMPILITSLVGSQAALSRGGSAKDSNLSSMINLKDELK